MDKLELDDRVSRLERRVSFHSVLIALVGLVVLGAALMTARSVSPSHYASETSSIVMTPAPEARPTPPVPSQFEVELREAHQMHLQHLITREDFDQKKEMILAAPMTFSNDVEAMKAAKALVTQGVLSDAEFDVLKRKILKFGK